MTLTLASDAPFSVDFTGVAGMQCMGSTAYTPGAYPNGITSKPILGSAF